MVIYINEYMKYHIKYHFFFYHYSYKKAIWPHNNQAYGLLNPFVFLWDGRLLHESDMKVVYGIC